MWTLILVLITAIAAAPSRTGRQVIPFRYGWRFTKQLAHDDTSGPGTCAFDHPVNNMSCTNMERNPNRVTPDDCRLACCYEPTCFVWQQGGNKCLWGGANSTCSKQGSSQWVGGQRKGPVPPFKHDYAYSAGTEFDDSAWQQIDLPFDSLANGTFTDTPDIHHGFLPRNVSWFRKHFTLPSSAFDKDSFRAWYIEFEGVHHYTQIWINGQYVLNHSIAYTPFALRLTSSMLEAGKPAVISVRTDASYGSGHWYEGGGIRWDVNLVSYNAVHIPRYGAFLVPQVAKASHSTIATVEVIDEDLGLLNESYSVKIELSDTSAAAQEESALVSCTAPVPSSLPAKVVCHLDLTGLSRWSVHTPVVFVATASLLSSSVVVDSVSWEFGFRDVVFTPDNGMSMDGVPVKLRGFSHHDSFSGMGVAMPPRFDLFRAQAGRALGHNVWRMSHNPYHPSLYRILNYLGIIVWDENRDLGPWYSHGMGTMVRRDRNHPSIVLWSFCNEIECYQYNNNTGYAFRAAALAEDTSRPLTSNVNGGNFIVGIDVQGFSHQKNATFEEYHTAHPSVPLVLSECCSCSTQRLPVDDRLASTDCMFTQNSPLLNADNIGSLGVWTLFDYYGESHKWPNYACSFGQFDIAGTPKPHAYWYTVNWLRMIPDTGAKTRFPPSSTATNSSTAHSAYILDLPDVLICTSGNCTITGIATTNDLRLSINGKPVTSKPVPAYDWPSVGAPMTWTVPEADLYQPGTADASCDFPVDLSGSIQCRGCQKFKDATDPSSCEAECCHRGFPNCTLWQFAPDTGCWLGGGNPKNCEVSPKRSDWKGSGYKLVNNVKTITLEAFSDGDLVASSTVKGPAANPPTQLKATVDIPSLLTGTGTALVLDGVDAGMVRVQLCTADGVPVSDQNQTVRVQWSITSGPGRIMGIGSGDPAAHDPQLGTSVNTFGSIARAMVQVTVDCTSPNVGMAADIDSEIANVKLMTPDKCTPQPIVVRAEANIHGQMVSATASIATSTKAVDTWLAVAQDKHSVEGYAYLESFW